MAKRKNRKHKRDIHCTVCGKDYSDPIAAQKHVRKHPKTDQSLVLVVSRPRGNMGVQRMADPNLNVGGIGIPYPSSSSQPTPSNLAAHAHPNFTDTTFRIPQVAAPPGIYLRRGPKHGEKLSCPLCPQQKFRNKVHLKRHTRRWHKIIHKVCNRNSEERELDLNCVTQCTRCPVTMDAGKEMQKHSKKAHGVPWCARQMLVQKNPKAINYQDKTIPDIPYYPSMEVTDDEGQMSSEDEGQLLSENEEQLSSEDEGHLSLEEGGQPFPEDEQQSPPMGKGKQPARDNGQSFSCGLLCPETFPSAEAVIMHWQAVHCWRCGYCRDLRPFSSVSLWREHRMMVHGLVG